MPDMQKIMARDMSIYHWSHSTTYTRFQGETAHAAEPFLSLGKKHATRQKSIASAEIADYAVPKTFIIFSSLKRNDCREYGHDWRTSDMTEEKDHQGRAVI
jgi:hypothetical protein